MRVLVTGACGLLGAHLMAACAKRHDVTGIDRHAWWGDEPMRLILGDLAMPGILEDTIAAVRPQVVVHCAALVNVDMCEQQPAQAYEMNSALTRRLVHATPKDCRIVYISTDGVFKGDRPHATEEDLPCPRTVYARSKLQGEWDVALASEGHLVVRTNFYGWSSGRKQTAAEWLYQSLASGAPITLFHDFFFSPIYVVDAVQRLMVLIERGDRGLLHLAGADRVSKYQFGAMMAEATGFSMARVEQGSIDSAALAAPRPKDMSLSSRRFRELTGMTVPGCAQGLGRFLADRGRPLSERLGSPQRSLLVSSEGR